MFIYWTDLIKNIKDLIVDSRTHEAYVTFLKNQLNTQLVGYHTSLLSGKSI